ncbi:hypothetical protein Hdeb2414_s0120g00802771 [Helianthus debilis subsp. tardiflorus]
MARHKYWCGSCCCMKTQPGVNAYPSYRPNPSHMLSACLPTSESSARFGRRSAGETRCSYSALSQKLPGRIAISSIRTFRLYRR